MSTHPIHIEGTNLKKYGDLDHEQIKEMIRRACTQYVPQIKQQMLNFK